MCSPCTTSFAAPSALPPPGCGASCGASMSHRLLIPRAGRKKSKMAAHRAALPCAAAMRCSSEAEPAPQHSANWPAGELASIAAAGVARSCRQRRAQASAAAQACHFRASFAQAWQ
eukprot:4522614-Prymnesium_polylepis.1